MPKRNALARLRHSLAQWLVRGTPAPDDDFWYSPVPGRSTSGRKFTSEQSMRLVAVYGSVRVLSDDNSAQPIHLIEDTSSGRQRVREHPLYDVLRYKPNDDMTATDLRKAWIVSRALTGNAYGFIKRTEGGRVEGLEFLHPDNVTPKQDDKNGLYYEYRDDPRKVKPADRLHQQDVLHFKGVSHDGITGISPIAAVCNPISAGMSADEYTEGVLQGANQRLVFETDENLTHETREALSEDYHRKYAGAHNAWRVPFLVAGLKAKVLSVSPVDMQLLDMQKHTAQTISMGIYGVPAFRIGVTTETDTFASLTAHQLAYAIYTMLPINVSIEQEMMRKLLTREERQRFTIEHLMDSLLRADPEAQSKILSTGVMHGRYTLNDVRDMDNRSRFGELADEPMIPSTMMPLSQMQNRDSDPVAPVTDDGGVSDDDE